MWSRGGLDRIVGTGVDEHVRAVRVVTNTVAICRLTERVGSYSAAIRSLIARFDGHPDTEVVTPAFAGLLGILQTGGGIGATCQTIGNAVTVFVDDDTVVEITIPHWACLIPQEHLHAGIAAIGRRGEIGVVHTAAVLRLGIDRITAHTITAKIVLLEIPGELVEAVRVEDIVDEVVPVEEVGDRRILVFIRLLREIDREIKVVPGGVDTGPGRIATGR